MLSPACSCPEKTHVQITAHTKTGAVCYQCAPYKLCTDPLVNNGVAYKQGGPATPQPPCPCKQAPNGGLNWVLRKNLNKDGTMQHGRCLVQPMCSQYGTFVP